VYRDEEKKGMPKNFIKHGGLVSGKHGKRGGKNIKNLLCEKRGDGSLKPKEKKEDHEGFSMNLEKTIRCAPIPLLRRLSMTVGNNARERFRSRKKQTFIRSARENDPVLKG